MICIPSSQHTVPGGILFIYNMVVSKHTDLAMITDTKQLIKEIEKLEDALNNPNAVYELAYNTALWDVKNIIDKLENSNTYYRVCETDDETDE